MPGQKKNLSENRYIIKDLLFYRLKLLKNFFVTFFSKRKTHNQRKSHWERNPSGLLQQFQVAPFPGHGAIQFTISVFSPTKATFQSWETLLASFYLWTPALAFQRHSWWFLAIKNIAKRLVPSRCLIYGTALGMAAGLELLSALPSPMMCACFSLTRSS